MKFLPNYIPTERVSSSEVFLESRGKANKIAAVFRRPRPKAGRWGTGDGRRLPRLIENCERSDLW